MMLFFNESFSIKFAYTSRPYVEAMTMRLDVSYIPCGTSLRWKTGNIITFAQFEEEVLLS